MTYDEALAQWKADNPEPVTINVNGEDVLVTGDEYEAMAADRAQILMAQDAQQQAANTQAALEEQVVGTQPTLLDYAQQLQESASNAPLADPLPAPQAGEPPDLVNMPELQLMVSDLMTLVHQLIEALEGKGVLRAGEVVEPRKE